MMPKWLMISVIVAACLLAAGFTTVLNRGDADEPVAQEAAEDDTHASSNDSPHPNKLKFDEAAQERIGLAVATAREATIQPEIKALGMIEEDPAGSFTVRAPIAGFLQSAGDWPAMGATIGDGTLVGAVQPRITPLEQFGLATQYVEARSALAEIEAELAAAQASYESKRILNADGKKVSDRQFDEAEAKLGVSRAKLAGAQEKVALLEKQQGAVDRGLPLVQIRAERGGEVVELLAGPGEAVESGQALLRVTRRDRVIARIELPLGECWDAGADARIAVVGAEPHVFRASSVVRSAHAGSRTRGQAWLLAIDDAGSGLAAGTPVIAFLATKGEPLKGVLVPSSAILRYAGLSWVFVRGEDDVFERELVQLYSPTPEGWFVTGEIEAGATVVVRGAQMLLSEQLKAEIEAEAEAAE